MVATLPLLASFLDERGREGEKARKEEGEKGNREDAPFEVGPYSPASRLFWIVIVLWAATTAATAALAPEIFSALAARPLAWLASAIFLAEAGNSARRHK